jgi:hypothetical protein
MVPDYEPGRPFDFASLVEAVRALESQRQQPAFSLGDETAAGLLPRESFDAEVTDGSPGAPGWWGWKEKLELADGTWVDRPAGRSGTTSFQSARERNDYTVQVPVRVRMHYGDLDRSGGRGQTFVFDRPGGGGGNNKVTCVSPVVTSVACVNNRLQYTWMYLRIDWANRTATLVDTCTPDPNPNVVPAAPGTATGGSTAVAIGSGAGVSGTGSVTGGSTAAATGSGAGVSGTGASSGSSTVTGTGAGSAAGVGTATGGSSATATGPSIG